MLDLGVIYTGLLMVAATWALGALTTTVFGLDLVGAVWALVVGNTLAGLLLGLASVIGEARAPQMFLGRFALGTQANTALAMVNFISTIIWFSANTVSVTYSASHVLPALGIPDNECRVPRC
ncbi:MAG: cytosine permease, partial [Chloroflexi bacterium]|nr:cytosine permease [Chloroflexota bacterium]